MSGKAWNINQIHHIEIIDKIQTHNPKVRGSNPLPATNKIKGLGENPKPFHFLYPSLYPPPFW